MDVQIIREEKNEMEFEVDSVTIAELLRQYLNQDSSVELAVWRREHPTKNPQFLLKTKGKTPKKAINDTISKIVKELDNIEANFKKLK